MSKRVYVQLAVITFAAIMVASLAGIQQGQVAPQAVTIDNDDIGGVVSGPRGPEAGVWVIAETKETPTRLIKSVVTDDRGRYLLPDLPKVNYDVWVRGYGLVDSPKVKAAPGKAVNLTAIAAPGPRAAADYYPAQYWLSLLQMPPKSDFPGTGANGNGISESMRSQGEWIRNIVNTDGCTGCHQLGNRATREIPEALGTFPTSIAAWDRRIQSGQAGNGMSSKFTQVGGQLSARAQGTSNLRPQLMTSSIDTCFEFRADAAFLEKNPKIKTALQLAEVRLKKDSDGYLHVPLVGTLQSPRLRGGLCRHSGSPS